MLSWLDPATAKACMAFALACGTMLFASIPVLLSTRSYHHRSGVRHVLTGLSCFGGGIFLSTLFLHLLPDAVEMMEDARKESTFLPEFPMAYALVIAGFMLVVICEEFLRMCNNDSLELGHSHGPPPLETVGAAPVPDYGAIRRNQVLSQTEEVAQKQPQEDEELEDPGDDSDNDEDRMTTVSMHGDPGSHTAFRAIILVFSLSLHSIFEGITIGLEKSTQKMMEVLGVIAVHKSVIAVTLATNLVSSSTKLKPWAIFTSLAIFSSMAPLGMLLTFLTHEAPAEVNGVLQCIACGTFLYITFFEILPHELNSRTTRGSRIFKIMMVLLGIGLVIGMVAYLPDTDHAKSSNGTQSH